MVFSGVPFRVSDFHSVIGTSDRFVFPPTPSLSGLYKLYPLKHLVSLK